jgi:hypothetical protein
LARNEIGNCVNFQPLVVPGTLNQFNTAIPLDRLITETNNAFNGGFGLTLPTRELATPKAHHYSVSIEQQLGANLVLSAAYIGTQGRNLLRLNTPNLGENLIALLAPSPLDFLFNLSDQTIGFAGIDVAPGTRLNSGCQFTLSPTMLPSLSNCLSGGRPTANAGAILRYETTAESRYDALQLQLRGRFRQHFQYQLGYTFSKVLDDVSDVFDLAGAPALPQDSRNLAAERGPANFDVRHRFTYDFTYNFPSLNNRARAYRFFLGGFGLAGTGQVQSGQPFTINSIYDVNLDGNLTDRLNATTGLVRSPDRRQPLEVPASINFVNLRAEVGKSGAFGRNTFARATLSCSTSLRPRTLRLRSGRR